MTDYGPPPRVYASWPIRVGGYLLDSLFTAVFVLPGYTLVLLGTTTTTTTYDDFGQQFTSTDADTTTTLGMVLVYLLPLAFFVWNSCVRQGRTGYTYGKQLVGIKLIGEQTGTPIGAGRSFGRQVAHVLDTLPCYLGWLWPLWDRKCQTFADKVMDTVVVVQR